MKKESSDEKKFIHIGAEVILTVMIAPFLVWVTTAIFNLQASSGSETIKIDQIKEILEKQDKKIDNIMELLITKGR